MVTRGILEEIAQYLEDNLVGTRGVNIWVNFMPEKSSQPTDIAIYSSSGTPTIYSSVVPDFGFQIVVRSNSITADGYHTGRQKALDIYNLLHNKRGFLMESTVTLCWCLNYPPIEYRNPESEKWEFSMNFRMTCKEVYP